MSRQYPFQKVGSSYCIILNLFFHFQSVSDALHCSKCYSSSRLEMLIIKTVFMFINEKNIINGTY